MCDAMLACVMFLRWCCVGYNAVCYVMYVWCCDAVWNYAYYLCCVVLCCVVLCCLHSLSYCCDVLCYCAVCCAMLRILYVM
jgi:hypothetical protein